MDLPDCTNRGQRQTAYPDGETAVGDPHGYTKTLDRRRNGAMDAMQRTIFTAALHEIHRKTPKEYYLDARLELALSLFRQGNYSVGQVADLLNFFDSFHFSKAFKKKFGYAPSAVNQ